MLEFARERSNPRFIAGEARTMPVAAAKPRPSDRPRIEDAFPSPAEEEES